MSEFWKKQHFFVRHFVLQSIVRKGVLPKNRSLLWDWTPSHAQRIYKGQNSENPLRAITFDWSDLRTWFQRLWATFLILFSGIPHSPTLCNTWHVTYVTHVTHVTWHMWRTQGGKKLLVWEGFPNGESQNRCSFDEYIIDSQFWVNLFADCILRANQQRSQELRARPMELIYCEEI